MKILTNRTCTLSHLSIRTETHGEIKVGAADIKIKFTAPNDVLNEFGPGLREALFRPATPDPDVAQLFESETPLLSRKYPMLQPIGFDERGES